MEALSYSSISVQLGQSVCSPVWSARALSRSKIDKFVQQTQHVNLNIVRQPDGGRTTWGQKREYLKVGLFRFVPITDRAGRVAREQRDHGGLM